MSGLHLVSTFLRLHNNRFYSSTLAYMHVAMYKNICPYMGISGSTVMRLVQFPCMFDDVHLLLACM